MEPYKQLITDKQMEILTETKGRIAVMPVDPEPTIPVNCITEEDYVLALSAKYYRGYRMSAATYVQNETDSTWHLLRIFRGEIETEFQTFEEVRQDIEDWLRDDRVAVFVFKDAEAMYEFISKLPTDNYF